jgi:uncharacterized RmlC-like cupin family protein
MGNVYQGAKLRGVAGVVVIRGGSETETPQGLPYRVGVSRSVCGSTGISLSYVVVPPGATSEPHSHDGYETAIYQLAGRVETRFGEALEEAVVTEAGDFLFVPPGVPHQAVNLSATEPAVALIARNDAEDADRVLPYDPPRSSSR